MDKPPTKPAAPSPAPAGAVYPQRDNPSFEAELAGRTTSEAAAFVLPYLRPGMHLLDVGCGPGSITLGLAEIVAPGEVVGIDMQPSQVERARVLAVARRVANVRFEVADVYCLPFADGSFDVVFAHAVLMHLHDPLRALKEMRRLLRPGGIAGIRDPDWGADLFTPTTPLLEQWRALRVRVRQHNGGDPFLGRHHRRLLLEAGFAQAEATATVESVGTLEQARRYAAWLKAQLQGFARTAMAEGWVDQATLDAILGEIEAWAERPDAFSAGIWCAAVGRVDHAPCGH